MYGPNIIAIWSYHLHASWVAFSLDLHVATGRATPVCHKVYYTGSAITHGYPFTALVWRSPYRINQYSTHLVCRVASLTSYSTQILATLHQILPNKFCLLVNKGTRIGVE